MIIQVLSNSMIFPCMERFKVIFQLFHDLQSLWEPCTPQHVILPISIMLNYIKLSKCKIVNILYLVV